MKRWFSLALAAALLMGLSARHARQTRKTTALPRQRSTSRGSMSRAQVARRSRSNITWEPIEFTYLDGDPVWDCRKATEQIGSAKPGWTDETKNITVTNHSNTDYHSQLPL